MDNLSAHELREVPTEKLIEQIERLLTEVRSRDAAVQTNGFHVDGNKSVGLATQNGVAGQATLAKRVQEAGLSQREHEVLLLMGEGLKTSVIAERLQLSVHTIETYREKIKHKLQLQNAAELWHFAVRWGMEKNN